MNVMRGKIGELTQRVKVGFVGTCEKYYTDNKTYPMIRTTNLSETGINYSDMKYVTEDFFAKNKKSQLHDGDVLIARFGTSGTACVYHGGNAQCLNAIIVEPDLDTTIPEYLAIVINSRNVREQVNKRIVGSTQAILNTKVLSDIEIELPSKQEQKKIVDIIYSIRYISKQRTMELKKLDDLIKARFVEMFGDNESNPKGWKQSRIGDCCTLKSGTSLPAEVENEGGPIPYVKVGDMNYPGNERYITTSSRYVSTTTVGNGLFAVGSILFPKRGGAIGTNKKRMTTLPICADLNIMGVSSNGALLPEYLLTYFDMIDLGALSDGSSVPQINNKNIAPLLICLPPMELQREFASFVSQVDKSKAAVQAALDKARVMFDGLMQEYFG